LKIFPTAEEVHFLSLCMMKISVFCPCCWLDSLPRILTSKVFLPELFGGVTTFLLLSEAADEKSDAPLICIPLRWFMFAFWKCWNLYYEWLESISPDIFVI
jgi:hypothetical protein